MIVSIHQPAYLPWLGYLARIAASDVFVLLDTVQFERNSFVNRNRIKTAQGPLWLTVPVLHQGHLDKQLLDMEIDERRDWRRKHVRSIEQNYRSAARFAENRLPLASLFGEPEHRLTELCVRQLEFWLSELSIGTPVVRASDLPVTGQKSDLVLAICRHLGAKTYLSGPLGRGYLSEEDFAAAGIVIHYYDYRHPTYPQPHGAFLPAMSVVDYWLTCGDPQLFRQPISPSI